MQGTSCYQESAERNECEHGCECGNSCIKGTILASFQAMMRETNTIDVYRVQDKNKFMFQAVLPDDNVIESEEMNNRQRELTGSEEHYTQVKYSGSLLTVDTYGDYEIIKEKLKVSEQREISMRSTIDANNIAVKEKVRALNTLEKRLVDAAKIHNMEMNATKLIHGEEILKMQKVQNDLNKSLFKSLKKNENMRAKHRELESTMAIFTSEYSQLAEENKKLSGIANGNKKELERLALEIEARDVKLKQLLQNADIAWEKYEDTCTCVVCQDAHPSVLLSPCLHVCVCNSCMKTFYKANIEKCPICSANVDNSFSVFFN